MRRRRRSRFGATITRRPPLPYPGWDNTNMILREGRVGYQTLPVQPVPIIRGGQTVDYTPYPSTQWPIGNQGIFPNPSMGLRGYGQYLNREALKKWSWGSFGVGLGAAAGTMALGLLVAGIVKPKIQGKRGKRPGALRTLSPFLLPSLGAGVLAYLLRHQMEQGLAECPEAPPCPPSGTAPVLMHPPTDVVAVLQQPECPQNMVWDPDRGICVGAPGALI